MNTQTYNDDTETVVPIIEAEDSFSALTAAKKAAAKLGFNEINQALIATVVSELATNILRYAGTGNVFISPIKAGNKAGLEIKAVDKGPGIGDIETAMADNFSTTKNSLGLGLASLKRIMDEYEIRTSPDEGTTIVTRKWRTADAS